MHSMSRSCPTAFEPPISLNTTAAGFNKRAVYTYSVTAGQIIGEGSKVSWDLSGGPGPGYYTATVEVKDNKQRRAVASATVTIANCGDCIITHDLPCGMIYLDCYDQVKAGTPITCKAAARFSIYSPITLEWSARASNDKDLSARIKKTGEYVSIPTNDLAGRTVYVSVDVIGLDPSCNRSAAASTVVKP
jgi:hypothetical protein